MKKLFFFVFIIIFFSTNTSSLYACQPCHYGGIGGIIYEAFALPRFISEIKNSDLIIIGQRTDFEEGHTLRPTNIKIKKVLKGSVDQDVISVQKMYGMCAYGIFINDDKDYVLFLKNYEATDLCGIQKLSFGEIAKMILAVLLLFFIIIMIIVNIIKKFRIRINFKK